MSELSLVEFLTARLDDDEAVAWGGAPSPWTSGGWDGGFEGPREVLDRHGDVTARTYYGGTHGHVLRFDPTRVLAEVEAKRRFIAEAEDQVSDYFSRFILETLALPFADHPDYREEWRP